jgi:hypothetical protein
LLNAGDDLALMLQWAASEPEHVRTLASPIWRDEVGGSAGLKSLKDEYRRLKYLVTDLLLDNKI